MKKLILVFIFVITLISLILYYTYAIDVSMDDTTSVVDQTFNINIKNPSSKTVTVPAGDVKVFDINITNSNGDSIKYGIAYSGTKPASVIIVQSDSSRDPVSGIIANNTTKQITIAIENRSNTSYTYTILPVTGYQKGGDLILPNGYTLINSSITSLDVLNKLKFTSKGDRGYPDRVSPVVNTYKESHSDEANRSSLSSTNANHYFTYASSYTFDSSTGTYSLVSPSVGKYNSMYSSLNGKYIVDLIGESSSSLDTYTGLTEIYKVLNPTYNSSDSTGLYYYNNYFSAGNQLDLSDTGVYETEDDFGTSYYFRGAVTNNYVKFGTYKQNVYLGYKNGGDFRQYDSLSACQNASDYNSDCKLGISTGTSMYWRIVRIEGNGNIRLIYDGTTAKDNDKYSKDRLISHSAFNELYGDNTYSGYMYANEGVMVDGGRSATTSRCIFNSESNYYFGTGYTYDPTINKYQLSGTISYGLPSSVGIGKYSCRNVTSSTATCPSLFFLDSLYSASSFNCYEYEGVSSTPYSQTHANLYNSTIKSFVDSWYSKHLLNSSFTKFISNNTYYCNDRTPVDGSGAGKIQTDYDGKDRIVTDVKASLKCQNMANDGFSTSSSSVGNKKLTYPIGMLTVDEAAYMGMWKYDQPNKNSFLYASNDYYTMTASWFSNKNIFNAVSYDGSLIYNFDGTSELGVRPVISLKGSTVFSGSGTKNDPFVPKFIY